MNENNRIIDAERQERGILGGIRPFSTVGALVNHLIHSSKVGCLSVRPKSHLYNVSPLFKRSNRRASLAGLSELMN